MALVFQNVIRISLGTTVTAAISCVDIVLAQLKMIAYTVQERQQQVSLTIQIHLETAHAFQEDTTIQLQTHVNLAMLFAKSVTVTIILCA